MAFYANTINEEDHIMKLSLIENFFSAFSKTFKSAINELKKAELRYQTLFKAARDAILIIDEKSTKILDVNKQAEKILEMDKKELIGLNALDLSPKEPQQNFFEQIRRNVNLNDAPPIELQINSPTGKEIPVEISINQINLEGQKLIQCILRDITERKKAEEELIMSEKRYRNAYEDINFYKDLFTHDMRNILQSITTSLELYDLKNEMETIQNKEFFEKIHFQINRAAHLINNIKKFSELESFEQLLEKMNI